MAWNEQYARILEQMKKNSTTSTSISGADTKNDEPDCLFYTNFSRETAEAFYDIFEKFKGYYKQNPSVAIDTLFEGNKTIYYYENYFTRYYDKI